MKYNELNDCQLQYQELDIPALRQAPSCGVFHTDLGVYVENSICKPRAPQKNNRGEVQGNFMETFPFHIYKNMSDSTFEKWGGLSPSQYTATIMKEIYHQNRQVYDAMNRWFWCTTLANKVHYLLGWIHCKLTHNAISVKYTYLYCN